MTDHQHLFWKGKKMEEQKMQKNVPLIDAEKALNFIQTLEYTDEEGILYLEQQLYNLLQKTPNDVNLLVLLLHEQIMHNRGRRARTIAYKIWENGGDLSVVSEHRPEGGFPGCGCRHGLFRQPGAELHRLFHERRAEVLRAGVQGA